MRGMDGIVVTAVSPLSAIVLVMLSLRDSEDAHTLWVPYTSMGSSNTIDLDSTLCRPRYWNHDTTASLTFSRDFLAKPL